MAAPSGLSTAEAQRRLAEHGPNAVPEARRHPLRAFLGKLWAPVPWMLEIAIVLQLMLGKPDEAAVIALLLVVNAVLSYAQESRANQALALLKQRLAIQARVRRDERWQRVPAEALVPGDVIHLRMGDLAPADLRLIDGKVQLDQAALTGESLPVEAGSGASVYAGSVIKRGEATGEVTATGTRTYFGHTADLVRTARTVSHLGSTIFTIVRYLVALDVLLVAALIAYALATGLPLADVAPFALILLVASVPVALPATFTVATALGARALAERGVLVTRLSAIEEAAAMDVLATDKTGTLTANRLGVAALSPHAPYGEEEVLRLAALACDEATQDPIDLAILDAARGRALLATLPTKTRFVPFDPQTKRAEAVYPAEGGERRAIKGAARTVAALCVGAPDVHAEVERLADSGYRVLGIADGVGDRLEFVGLVAMQDPPRPDARQLVENLQALGVRVLMVTGDGLATARAVAAEVGLGTRACGAEVLRSEADRGVPDCDVFARVLPEDKFRLVQALQRAGHVAGMTGDGVNDAPALKQAEMGTAVASATDVAKASASLVLTRPGLGDVVAAVETSRRIHQRMLTYTLNKIIKTLEIAVFLSLGLMLTGVFVVTPLLIVLLLFTNDFATMAIATDHASFSQKPDRWHVRTLMVAGGAIAACLLALSFSVFFAARAWLGLTLPQLQTLMFLMLVFSGQGTVYLVRERRHFWQSAPSRWLVLVSLLDIALVGGFATRGILMAAVPFALVAGLLLLVSAYLVLVDFLKIRVFRRLGVK
ncbi:plasma-membrane proton-efflux P-type ATPase [Thiobacillus sedimenti]|uniref:Plasma-membrane proton-efflux P-type ATPase n=1 Tax=Thiobacillus sedimenti TaxID=3110231 RepID=A0ABZ1CJ08_9PROT|nr:plasma-membrane proton-efflux P-type ATPase [Thiobacillus sp. SCUT-2]WRS39373.1 plasma-membrane proton-efflux P-type ATPase [Thiobacillus sp. SCUT-2]